MDSEVKSTEQTSKLKTRQEKGINSNEPQGRNPHHSPIYNV